MTDEENFEETEDDIYNTYFECPKCGSEHEKYSDSEYYHCEQCCRFCCKNCRFICDSCNEVHCFRCSNYYETCCKILCSNCSRFCEHDNEYHCKCIESCECDDCEEIICEKHINKRKNNKMYCEDCNINYCENCDKYSFETVCQECIVDIKVIFNEKLPIELIREIIEYINF